ARSGNDQHDRSENNQVPGRVLEPAQEKEPENHGGDADSEQQGDEPAGKRINGAIAVHGLLNHAAGRPASGFEVPVGRQEKQRTDDQDELSVAHGLIPKRRLTVDIYSNLQQLSAFAGVRAGEDPANVVRDADGRAGSQGDARSARAEEVISSRPSSITSVPSLTVWEMVIIPTHGTLDEMLDVTLL